MSVFDLQEHDVYPEATHKARYVENQREAERSMIRKARERGGRMLCGQGDVGTALRLKERGVGHWEQTHPFLFEFVLHPDFMADA